MTITQRDRARQFGSDRRRRGTPWHHVRYTALAIATVIVALAACQDSVVPYFTAPTSVPNSQAGVRQAVLGLFSYTRNDQTTNVLENSSFAREAGNFTNTDPRWIEFDLGIKPIPIGAWLSTWENEYVNIREAQEILAELPKTSPAYSPGQLAGLTGVVQTMEAVNYLMVVWAHDSLGMAIMQSPDATTPALAVCLKDGLQYIVALLDSANTALNAAGATPFPFALPPGFAAVAAVAGPSTVAGSFASFNRALAAKAGLELAYAIAHQSGAAPDTVNPGSPDVSALTRADSAATALALYNPAALSPNPTGQWTYDNYSVLYDFSAQSGDIPNPINGVIGTAVVLNDVPNDQDTVHDLRWKAKFQVNPHAVQEQPYNFVASKYIYGMYPNPASPIPIIRNETLVLVRAQIRLGLGDYPGALALLNDVRTQVGGLTPTSASTYHDVLYALMREQQISTLMEGGADRVIALRMYGLATVLDTTWKNTTYAPDQHTTVQPISELEYAGRGGTFSPTCK